MTKVSAIHVAAYANNPFAHELTAGGRFLGRHGGGCVGPAKLDAGNVGEVESLPVTVFEDDDDGGGRVFLGCGAALEAGSEQSERAASAATAAIVRIVFSCIRAGVWLRAGRIEKSTQETAVVVPTAEKRAAGGRYAEKK